MNQNDDFTAQKIVVTGARGLVGTALCAHLRSRGHSVVELSRGDGTGATWNQETGAIDAAVFEGCDAVVHLAGESVAGFWTEKKKAGIRDSRVGPTRRLAASLAALPKSPATFVCASASGYYGADRGGEILSEESSAGSGFLAQVCQEWEKATKPADDAGIRVINTRFGIILSREGGALAAMLLPFKLGLGGTLGNGKQWMSWIALEDVARAIEHVVLHEELNGPVNFAAPYPVTNREFTRTLGRVLRRPTGFPIPGWVLRVLLREAADEMLLSSIRMLPVQLEGSGFEFRYEKVREALRGLVKIA
jgi:uncharacterized protein (TIGR01777 family)